MSDARLGMADERLRTLWPDICAAYEMHHSGHALILTCVYRSPAEQAALYAKGRTAPGQIVTYCDGVTTLSKHNAFPARALDFAVLVGGKVSWDSAEYAPVGMLAEERGLVWGGNWISFVDAPHIEIQDTK